MFLGERVKLAGHHLLQDVFEFALRTPFHLQQQTLLQRPGANACGVEPLQDVQHLLYLRGRDVDVVVDGQFVTNRFYILSQVTVVVERTDEVFHHVFLRVREVLHHHLLFQFVVERFGVSVDNLLIIGVVLRMIGPVSVRHLIISADVFQGFVQCLFALFSFCSLGKIFLAFVLAIRFILMAFVPFGFLQRRIVIQFGIDTLLQFGQRHLQQLHLQHLLL